MPDCAKVAAWKKKERAKFAVASSKPRKKRKRKVAKGKNARHCKSRRIAVNAQGYPKEWTLGLRHHVRRLYAWRCAWCGERQQTLGDRIWLHVHHKDKNKRNCRINNLVPLCPDCHTLVAHGGYWSDLEGAELKAATKAQKAKIEAWAKVRREQKKMAQEMEQEAQARELGLTAE